ncbi:MAG: HPr family phosphocarrier protein [Clostridia bacterium]|nr:HPr family phosphocarrier protein [Clostridia bacterium]
MQTVKTVKIHFVTIADLYEFVAAATKYPFDVVLRSGHYNVDGKSLMGLYCLDLMNPIELDAHTDGGEEFFKEIEKFIVK